MQVRSEPRYTQMLSSSKACAHSFAGGKAWVAECKKRRFNHQEIESKKMPNAKRNSNLETGVRMPTSEVKA